MSLDFDAIKNLIEVSEKSDLSELIIEYEGVKIEIRRNPQTEGIVYSVPTTTIVKPASSPLISVSQDGHSRTLAEKTEEGKKQDILEEDTRYVKVLSPLVGVFYRAPWPGAKSFIEAGDNVTVGQTLCIVEAMKLMNEISSEISGKVVKILAENEEVVQQDQPLFLIDPA